MKVPLINIMKYYLSCQDIYVDQKLLQKYFASVLSFPSVFALIQTLKQFGVVLSVVSSDWYTLIQCDEKVLLHIDQEKDTWVMLKECSTDEVVYMDEHANVFTESRNSFTGKWDGLLLYVESVDENIQSALKKKIKKRRYKSQ